LLKGLCEHFDKLFLLKIHEIDKSYSIDYDLRKIAFINTIKLYNNMPLYDFINPTIYKKMYLLPPILEVIDLYNKLYDVALSKTWEETYIIIKKLETLVDNDLDTLCKTNKISDKKEIPDKEKSDKKKSDKKKSDKKKSDKKKSDKKGGKSIVTKSDKKEDKMEKIITLLLNFIMDNDYVLITDYAFYIENKVKNKNSVLEFISKNSIDVDFELMMNYLNKFELVQLEYKHKSVYINDYLTKKHSFYINKKHILNIFNNASYELISYYTVDNYKIADSIVNIRFIYISIWLNIVAQKIFKIKSKEFVDIIENKKKMLDFYKKNIDIYDNKINFIGVYSDSKIEIKKMALEKIMFKSSFYCHET
jgi:hypothetical protein